MTAAPIRRPPPLRRGDKIAVVTPSFPVMGAGEEALRRGVEALESAGYRVELGRHALSRTGYLAGSDADRAAELGRFFADPDVRLILATQGGSNANRLLEHLDWDALAASPTHLCGHSDLTVLSLALHERTGQVTCDGPNLITHWGIDPQPYTDEVFRAVCGEARAPGPLPTPPVLVPQLSPDREANRRAAQPHPGWRWLRGGSARGRLLGGHLASTLLLAGTPYFPSFEGKIWFWEELGGSLRWVDRYLTHARNLGLFEQISGMVVGHCLIDSEPAVTDTTLEQLILERTEPFDFPILSHVDCGHLSPRLTLPNGVAATLDSGSDLFSLDEPASAEPQPGFIAPI